MAEKIVSPGVFTNEVDQSFLPAGVQAIGAAIIGPTQKGPAGIPTIVSSYSEFVQKFGSKFSSGSGASENSYKYLTNYAAQEYLKYADTLTVVRIGANMTPANTIVSSSNPAVGDAHANGKATFINAAFADGQEARITQGSNVFRFIASANPVTDDDVDGNVFFFSTGSNRQGTIQNLRDEINNATAVQGVVSASIDSTTGLILSASSAGTSGNGITFATGSAAAAFSGANSTVITLAGGTNTSNSTVSFKLTTLSDGADQNSYTFGEGTNNTLASGSENNNRW